MTLRYGLGDSVSISTYFGSVGEIGVNTTTNTIHIFDSVTEGGITLAKSSEITGGAGLSTVGFSTGYGIHIDPIGTGVTFSEDLVVIGDARVTGILSIGTSSIVLDASDNSIKLSNDSIIRRNESTGDIEFIDNSDNLRRVIVNEIRIGSGNSVSVLKSNDGRLVIEDYNSSSTSGSEFSSLSVTGIATANTGVLISLYANTGIITTLSGSNINYSGLSTVANFKIAPIGSGATVGSSGIVTYYGDGSQLTGVGGELDITSSLFI